MKTQALAPTLNQFVKTLSFLGAAAAVITAGLTGMQAADKSSLPAAREVVDRFVKEIGGKDAYEKIDSQHAKGTYEMPAQGLKGDLEVFAARPHNLLVKIALPGVGDIASGFNGETAWMSTAATGPMLLTGEQATQLREQASFDSILHKPEDFKSMETAGEVDFEGKTCYAVDLVRKSGSESTEYYDKKTGLLAGFKSMQESPIGSMMVTNVLSDYKEFGGIQMATRIVQRMGPIEQVMKINSVEFGNLDPSIFELPAEVKALTEK